MTPCGCDRRMRSMPRTLNGGGRRARVMSGRRCVWSSAPRPVGGGRAAWPAYARRWQTAVAARAAAPARQRGRLDRAADRRAVGRVAAGDGQQERPDVRVPPAQAARRRPADHARARLHAPRSIRASSTSAASRCSSPRPATRIRRPRAEKLREALALWRGPPLADLAYEPFLQGEIARLEELRLAAIEQRIDADLTAGRHGRARRRAGGADPRASAEGAPERSADAQPLSLRPAGGGARHLPHGARRRSSTSSASSPVARSASSTRRSFGRTRTRRARRSGATVERSGSSFVGRERELAAARRRPRACLRGPRTRVPAERRAGHRQVAASPRSWPRTHALATPGCWSDAAGRPAAHRPTGRGCRPCAVRARRRRRRELRRQLGAGAADLAQIIPELRERLPGLPGASSLDPEGARFRLFDASSRFLRSAAQSRPIVLVLDDLHAADDPSLLLLRFLARELGSSRLLVLCAYRDVDPVPGDRLARMFAEIAREPVVSRARAGRAEPVRGRRVRRAHGCGAGLASAGICAARQDRREPAVRGRDRAAVLDRGRADEPQLAIPQSARDAIARRLAYVSQECNRLLMLASVLGREFALDVLARLGGVPDDQLLDTLDEAIAARIVSDVPGTPGRAALRARPDPRHALRRAPGRPPREAAPRRGRGDRAAAPGSRTRPRGARSPRDRRRRRRAGAPLRPPRRRPGARAARLRRGRPPVPACAPGPRPPAAGGPCRAQRAAARAGRCAHAGGQRRRREGDVPGGRRSRAATRGCPSCSRTPRSATGGSAAGCGPAPTAASYRCSRRRCRRSASRRRRSARGCWRAWPARCATSRRSSRARL